MSAQAVVEKGRRWRVGNGKSIHIWSDNWLPSISHPRVPSLVQASGAIAKVSDLIADGSGEWNSIVVRQVFCAEEANLILSIPLSIRLPMDQVVWGGTKNGKFIVSSAYHSIREMGSCSRGESSDRSCMKQVWKCIWALKLPNKVQCLS